MRVLSWNVYVGNKPANVAAALGEWLDTYHPEAVTLQEATHCWKVLARLAREKGYRHYQGVSGQAAGTAVLIRADVETIRRHELRMRRAWRGPVHGWAQDPRRYPVLRLRLPGGRVLRLMNLHFPVAARTSTIHDDPAVRESLRRTRRWLRRGLTRVPAIAVGDTNMGERALRTWLTGPVGRGSVVVPGHRADNLAARGAHGTAQTLGKHGSDHEAVLYTLTIGG